MTDRLEEDSPDLPFLLEMHETGHSIVRLARGRGFDEFRNDFDLLGAAERAMSIIGRAAANVSPRIRDEHTEVAWRQFIGMARLLEDDDDALDPAELWDAVHAVPAMVRSVAGMLPPLDDDGSG